MRRKPRTESTSTLYCVQCRLRIWLKLWRIKLYKINGTQLLNHKIEIFFDSLKQKVKYRYQWKLREIWGILFKMEGIKLLNWFKFLWKNVNDTSVVDFMKLDWGREVRVVFCGGTGWGWRVVGDMMAQKNYICRKSSSKFSFILTIFGSLDCKAVLAVIERSGRVNCVLLILA